jgi:hypothetical protein
LYFYKFYFIFYEFCNHKWISLIWKIIWKKNNRRNSVGPISAERFTGAAWPSGTTGLAGPCRGCDVGAVTLSSLRAQWRANRLPTVHAVSTPSTYQERASSRARGAAVKLTEGARHWQDGRGDDGRQRSAMTVALQ